MEILTYNNMKITVLRATSQPMTLVREACAMTMHRDWEKKTGGQSEQLLDFLLRSGHTSVLEHVTFTIAVSNISRSLLAQITRHRHMSPTSSSQHYQNYGDWPIVIHPLTEKQRDVIVDAASQAYTAYETAISMGVPQWEARQVLPNAAAVTMMQTWNARSLINFFEQRLCNRNVDEMQLFANRVRAALRPWWPEFFSRVGPDCKHCTQGHMRCSQGQWTDSQWI